MGERLPLARNAVENTTPRLKAKEERDFIRQYISEGQKTHKNQGGDGIFEEKKTHHAKPRNAIMQVLGFQEDEIDSQDRLAAGPKAIFKMVAPNHEG